MRSKYRWRVFPSKTSTSDKLFQSLGKSISLFRVNCNTGAKSILICTFFKILPINLLGFFREVKSDRPFTLIGTGKATMEILQIPISFGLVIYLSWIASLSSSSAVSRVESISF